MADLIAIAYPSEEKAEEVRKTILDLTKEYLISIEDAAGGARRGHRLLAGALAKLVAQQAAGHGPSGDPCGAVELAVGLGVVGAGACRQGHQTQDYETLVHSILRCVRRRAAARAPTIVNSSTPIHGFFERIGGIGGFPQIRGDGPRGRRRPAGTVRDAERREGGFDGRQRAEDHRRVEVPHMADAEQAGLVLVGEGQPDAEGLARDPLAPRAQARAVASGRPHRDDRGAAHRGLGDVERQRAGLGSQPSDAMQSTISRAGCPAASGAPRIAATSLRADEAVSVWTTSRLLK
jgi:hypothetical protein